MQKKNSGDNDGFPTVGVQQQPFCGDITGCNMYNQQTYMSLGFVHNRVCPQIAILLGTPIQLPAD